MTLLSIVHSSPHRHTSTIMWLHICKLQAMFLYIFCGYNTSLIQSVIRWQLHDIILYFYGHNLVQNWWVGGTPQGTPPPSGLDGVPPNGTGWGYPPCQDWMGVTPLFRTERGAPSPSLLSHPSPIGRQSRRASTCYAVGGMPLAFMLENFLVEEETWLSLTMQTCAAAQFSFLVINRDKVKIYFW